MYAGQRRSNGDLGGDQMSSHSPLRRPLNGPPAGRHRCQDCGTTLGAITPHASAASVTGRTVINS